MAGGSGEAQRPLPRGVLSVALPLASLLLVVIFALILFPYGRFAPILTARIAQASGASVSLDALEGGISLGGPSLLATGLLLRWPDGQELLLERARMRPAWSFSWLRGEPAVYLDAKGPAGTLAGAVWPGPGPAFAGRARGIQLSLLPLDHLADPLPVLGTVDAEIDLRSGPNGPAGEIRFEAREGSLALPQLAFGIPFEEAHGELERSESGAVTVREFELSGPMLSAAVEGSIGPSRRPEDGVLDLEMDLSVADPGLRSMIQPYGVRFDPEGAAHLRVSGTVASPFLQ
jgi:type II secretion system protein N